MFLITLLLSSISKQHSDELNLPQIPPSSANPTPPVFKRCANGQKKPGEALLSILVFSLDGPRRIHIKSDHAGAVLVVPCGHRFISPWQPPSQPVPSQVLHLSSGTLAGHRARCPVPIGESSAPATSRSRVLLRLLLLPLPPAQHEGMEAAGATRGHPGTVVQPLQQADGPDGPLADRAGGSGVGGSLGLDAGVAEHVSAGLHGSSGALQEIHADAADPDGSWR
ncbi:uncharacterized protein LOC128793250 [Vidua chalybeata]|uniref:uncharacterized protein LOC128793250 n=1 Tax=Vidua chalybeata TaxID=81927 RepID=UPI0023A893DB|nr:uncharacterized protein LOC128793250 [Vidua chalybeata]